MLRVLWHAAYPTRQFLRRWTPTNRLLAWLRTRRALKWGVPAMLLGVAYLFAAAVCTTLIGHGWPGWLYLIVGLFVYDGFKFLILGPISLLLLIRARSLDHRNRQTGTGRSVRA